MRSWRGSGSPRGVMVMIIQRETEEFRASKTHSALVDQSYQLTVNQDVKGVKNRALTHERNQQRSRLVLLSSGAPSTLCKFLG